MKYALIENNIVKMISYQPVEGWEEVSDSVCAEMIKKEDGTFDITDEVKTQKQQIAQAKTDKETNQASAKTKLKNLGLTDDEIKALTGN
jgi:phosphosulfolactate phosphohydrolase-like enzyme